MAYVTHRISETRENIRSSGVLARVFAIALLPFFVVGALVLLPFVWFSKTDIRGDDE